MAGTVVAHLDGYGHAAAVQHDCFRRLLRGLALVLRYLEEPNRRVFRPRLNRQPCSLRLTSRLSCGEPPSAEADAARRLRHVTLTRLQAA